MDFLPKSITTLIEELSSLPGIGLKTAQRLAFHLLENTDHRNAELGEAVRRVKEGVQYCSECFTLTSENPCRFCRHSGRDRGVLCVVESSLDLIAIEKTGGYQGLYHVLHGRLSPLDRIGPEDIKVYELLARLQKDSGLREIILAMNPDLEGDTTALYLQRELQTFPEIKVTRLARGLPAGASLEYSDPMTLVRALEGRSLLS